MYLFEDIVEADQAYECSEAPPKGHVEGHDLPCPLRVRRTYFIRPDNHEHGAKHSISDSEKHGIQDLEPVGVIEPLGVTGIANLYRRVNLQASCDGASDQNERLLLKLLIPCEQVGGCQPAHDF